MGEVFDERRRLPCVGWGDNPEQALQQPETVLSFAGTIERTNLSLTAWFVNVDGSASHEVARSEGVHWPGAFCSPGKRPWPGPLLALSIAPTTHLQNMTCIGS